MKNDWVDVFEIGQQTSASGSTETWSEKDLDEIISNFGTSDQNEVPVVIGHPKTDSPAYGWVDKIRKKGGKLQVKFRDLVEEFVTEAIKKKRWPNRSIRLTKTNKGWKLCHVGFLGAAAPAIKGLEPIYTAAEITNYQDYDMSTDEPNAAELKLVAMFEDFTSKIEKQFTQLQQADLKTEDNALKTISDLQTENKLLQAKIAEEKRNRQIQQFAAEVSSYQNLLPTQIEGLVEFMMSLDDDESLEFSYQDGNQATQKVNKLDFFRSFLKVENTRVSTDNLFSEIPPPTSFNNSDDPLTKAARNLIQDELGEPK